MADLRLETSDGEYLVLSLPGGESHRLLIDESLRKAVRREAITTDDSNAISPREIQLEVRAGISIEELVQKTGASLDYIQKFAAPVIDELAHVVKSALSVRITMAGDRYNESTQVEFGDVVANRLASQGVVNQTWNARKSDNGGWQVNCHYSDGVATWAFDARKLALSPENELAISLSTQQSLTEAPIPRLRSVLDIGPVSTGTTSISIVEQSAPSAPVAVLEAPMAQPEPLVQPVQLSAVPATQAVEDQPEFPAPVSSSVTDVIATEVSTPAAAADATPFKGWDHPVEASELSKPRQQAATERIAPVANITADLGQTIEFEGVVAFGRDGKREAATDELPASASAASLNNTADLLDALRRRRLEREQEVLSTATGAIDLSELPDFESAPEVGDFDGVDEPTPQTAPLEIVAESEPERPKKSARPSMPSWDEIVFNNRSDD